MRSYGSRECLRPIEEVPGMPLEYVFRHEAEKEIKRLQGIVNKLPSEEQCERLKGIAALAMDWRAAEVHHAACELGMRHDDKSGSALVDRTAELRIAVDSYKQSTLKAVEAKEE